MLPGCRPRSQLVTDGRMSALPGPAAIHVTPEGRQRRAARQRSATATWSARRRSRHPAEVLVPAAGMGQARGRNARSRRQPARLWPRAVLQFPGQRDRRRTGWIDLGSTLPGPVGGLSDLETGPLRWWEMRPSIRASLPCMAQPGASNPSRFRLAPLGSRRSLKPDRPLA